MWTVTRHTLNWLLTLRNRHFFGLDTAILAFTPWLAFWLRTDGLNTAPAGWADSWALYVGGLVAYTLLSLIIRLSIFYRMGLYRRYWRYASIEELDRIALAVFLSTALLFSLILFAHRGPIARNHYPLWNFPRSVVLIDGLLVLVLVGGTRFSVRLAARSLREEPNGPTERVAIMGAGDAGAMIAREMKQNPHLGLEPVCFFDDDLGKHDVRIHNIPVLGGRYEIPQVAREYRVRRVIIAMPTAPGKEIRQIVKICEEAGVQTQIVPGIYELLDGKVRLNQIRDVDIADLLRREPVQTDIAAVQRLLRGRRVLITGAGGSIGSELCRQIWRCKPSDLILLGHGENSIFAIHNELQAEERQTGSGNHATVLHAVIADVRFPERIFTIFEHYRPEIVFHAAAHKHVPLMEMNPVEAVTNNILGTRNLVKASLAFDVERFVMISTDKAVNPTNIMGASKRAAELIVLQAALENDKAYVVTRFGNVLGSRGSVLLTFKQQIARGGPVTVTHPDVRRYFMTIPEAVQLVLQASVLGRGGEVFVLDMGEPVKIVDLARDLVELSGLRIGEDIEIEFVGLRPGEKLFEELFIEGEEYRRTAHEKIFIAGNASRFVPYQLEGALGLLEEAANHHKREVLVQLLRHLVPEYAPAASDQGVQASGG